MAVRCPFKYPTWMLVYMLLWLAAVATQATTVVWHRSPLDFGSFRYVYDIELLRLVLDKTRPAYGDYQLQALPVASFPRLLHSLRNDTYPNLVLEISYDKALEESGELSYIRFPIELGIIGYRVCFVNPEVKDKVSQVTRLEQLRQFTIGQGSGWADIRILRHNGFSVTEVSNYTSLFKMVANGRFDLLCRGANELPMEYAQYQYIPKLTYNETFALVYPMPRFFYLNSKHQRLKQRLEEGLKTAYADGSLLALWRKHNLANVELMQLAKRKVFHLDNPLLGSLPKDYEDYLYNPFSTPNPQQASSVTNTQ